MRWPCANPLVTFDGTVAEVLDVSRDGLVVVVPRGTRGLADVQVLRGTQDEDLLVGGYRYEGGVPLAVHHVDPETLPLAGGWLTVVGDGLTPDTMAAVGGTAALDYEWVNEQVLRVHVPQGAAGMADLSLSAPGAEPLLVTDAVRFHDAHPVIDRVVPDFGTAAGGDVVLMEGTDFLPDSSVWFGAQRAEQVHWLSAQQLEVTTPSGFEGAVAVHVENADGARSVQRDGFYYEPVDGLVVDDVFPDAGSVRGGIEVALTGVGFEPGMQVLFGGVPSHWVSVDSTTSAFAIVPAHIDAATVDISVSLPSGLELTLPDTFTYDLRRDGDPGVGSNPDPDLPYLVGAISEDANHITLTFSEPMSLSSMRDPSHYAIFGDFSVASYPLGER